MGRQAKRAGPVAIFALIIAMIATRTSNANIEDFFTPPEAPGTYIWVGNHRLHLNCVGSGSPTVIFDSGLGGSSLDWVRVQPLVGSFTRACSYDRAGYAWSDAGPQPRDSASISHELELLLGNAGVPAPYLLVGHSFGGLNVRLYSYKNPQKVAGLVLVDASHEKQFQRFDEAGMRSSAPRKGAFFVRNSFHVPDGLPANVIPVAQSFATTRSSMVALRSELQNLRRSASQLQNIPRLPDVPVVVISHRVDTTAADDYDARRAKIWMDMQSDLARRATQGKHVIAATEDHYIHLSQPQLVVDSIKEVLEHSY